MHRFIESIRIFNGKMEHLPWHIERMQKTRKAVLGLDDSLDLENALQIPPLFQKGLVKCRVLYASKIEKIEFQPYQIRPIHSLKIIQDNTIDYTYKTEDRTALNQLFQQREHYDDIVIVKNGLVTDSYYANLIFDDGQQLFTPRQPLLKGVRRASLLQTEMIQEADIRLDDISQFKKVHLVNAMMELGECVVETTNIC
ncbi:MAG: aminotransferase class IV [Bacteroidota bacterium]